jgi:hypothetical protein
VIAVSVFIKQDGDKVSIASLAADDYVSKAIERMLCEQAEHVIKFVDAAHHCASQISKESP